MVENATICALTRAVEKDIDVAAASSALCLPDINEYIQESGADFHILHKFKSNREGDSAKSNSMCKICETLY